MSELDLMVFDKPEQRAIIISLIEDIERLREQVYHLEREVKWLRVHMPEPDLRYME